jgi:hypothetical protein
MEILRHCSRAHGDGTISVLADSDGAEVVELLHFGGGKGAIVDAEIVGFVVLHFPGLVKRGGEA